MEAPVDILLNCDKKLMYNENNKLYSLFPVAKKVLYTNIQQKCNAVEALVSDYFQHNIGGEGYVVEFYILQSMNMACNDSRLLALKQTKQTGTKMFTIQQVSELLSYQVENQHKQHCIFLFQNNILT